MSTMDAEPGEYTLNRYQTRMQFIGPTYTELNANEKQKQTKNITYKSVAKWYTKNKSLI